MLDVTVYSKKEFEETEFTDDTIDKFSKDYFICINATGHVHSIPHFKKPHPRVINCYFDDVEYDQVKFDTIFKLNFNALACTVLQATEIKTFIDTIPDSSSLHIYCSKGKSRSPAIAKFVEEYKNKKIVEYENHNRHVYETLKSLT
jgi:predicted protein tyrosine phosphatase